MVHPVHIQGAGKTKDTYEMDAKGVRSNKNTQRLVEM